MPYGWSPFPQTLYWEPFLYSEMLNDYAREIANSINDLTHRERRLRAWAAVLKGLTPRKVMDAQHELIADVATVGLGLPYVIRSRFLFATAHLSHQANRARLSDWSDDLPTDENIYMETADRFGRGWRRYRRLAQRLQRIGGGDFRASTGDFRNRYQHRFPQRVSQGLTQLVSREVGEGGAVSYGIGGRAPLHLDDIADALVVQRDRSYAAFDAFRALVDEQASLMLDKWPQPGSES